MWLSQEGLAQNRRDISFMQSDDCDWTSVGIMGGCRIDCLLCRKNYLNTL